jgi:dihydrofolate synthase/folylpolyglutamate synthase
MGAGLSAGGTPTALDVLASRTSSAWDLGLGRMRALLAHLGDPHAALPVIHVAGTNGKGSCVATLEAVLRAGGHRVARYTSPHLVHFRERIVVDGEPIPDAVIAEFTEANRGALAALQPTFFEATTALAFAWFADRAPDAVLLEVGLGGRLDATNVVARPLVAGVTSIGIDHQEYLGPTREQIAGEKAGIFKAGCPAVIGEPDPGIRAVLAGHARLRGATPVRVVAEAWTIDDVTVGHDGTRFRLGLPDATVLVHTALAGEHQAANAAAALAMLDALPEGLRVPPPAAAPALRDVRLPGRFQEVGRWIFDVAHNPDGVAVLAATLEAVRPSPPVWAVVSVLRDKDWRGMLRALVPHVDRVVLTAAPTAPADRAWSPKQAAAWAAAQGMAVLLEPDFDRALRRADAEAATVLVTGSFHTVGDAMSRLQVDPLDR